MSEKQCPCCGGNGWEGSDCQQQRWIPVLDRVPELGVDVLVLQRSGQCEVAWRHVVDGNWMSYAALGEITHWMPLPQPPKEVQG
jgi:hypothetical protein